MPLPRPQLPEKLKNYSGIIYFISILLVSNYFWKFTVIGSETSSLVHFFGMDISAPFVALSNHVAKASIALSHLFGSDVTLEPGNIIRNANGNAVRVIWSCSGLKQAYIFFCIIAFYRGSWKKKVWYVPLGILVVYSFNIIRISAIVAAIHNHPGWFDFLHEQFFKYLFYGVIFGMWVFWEEKMVSRKGTE